jgi:hypothetical protein
MYLRLTEKNIQFNEHGLFLLKVEKTYYPKEHPQQQNYKILQAQF